MVEDVSFAPGGGGDLSGWGVEEEGAWRADLRWVLAMLASDVQSLLVNELKLLSGGMSVGLTQFSFLRTSDSQWGGWWFCPQGTFDSACHTGSRGYIVDRGQR